MKFETKIKKELARLTDESDHIQAKIMEGWKLYQGDNIFILQGKLKKEIIRLKTAVICNDYTDLKEYK
jgi:hypothetical protein